MKILVLIAWLALPAVAIAQENPAASPAARHTLCAAANALLLTKMEEGMLRDVISYEANRHADAARTLGATNADLRQVIEMMGLSYNNGDITWDEISDLGEGCTKL